MHAPGIYLSVTQHMSVENACQSHTRIYKATTVLNSQNRSKRSQFACSFNATHLYTLNHSAGLQCFVSGSFLILYLSKYQAC